MEIEDEDNLPEADADGEMNDMTEAIDNEDKNSKEKSFKCWLNWTCAHVSMCRCWLKLADKIDS